MKPIWDDSTESSSAASTMSLLLLLVLLIAIPTTTSIEFYVSATGGAPCPSNTICHSLSYYVDYSYLYFSDNGTTFYFMEGTHILENALRVKGVSNLAFIGLSTVSAVQGYEDTITQSSVIIKCPDGGDAGITLFSSDAILFSNITIINCKNFSAAITLYHVTNTTLRYVSVQGSTLGVFLLNSCHFKVLWSSFIQNLDHVNVTSFHGIVATEWLECNITIQDTVFTGASNDGLTIFDSSDDYHHTVNINIDRVLFSSNSRWPILVILATASRHYLVVNNSFIVDNGQGISVEGIASVSSVIIDRSTLTGNKNSTKFLLYQHTSIIITSCYIGGSIHNQVLTFSGIYDSDSVTVTLSNVTITNNSWSYYPLAIFWTLKSVTINNCNFSYNTDTPLSLDQTHITFKGVNIFEGNSGYNGGAIQMDGGSQIKIYDNSTKMIFLNNHAYNHGGAIFVTHNQLFYIPFCILNQGMFPANTTIFYFNNNTADEAGSVLYGQRTENCDKIPMVNISDFTNQHGSSIISSNPQTACFCDNVGRPVCQLRNKTISAAPGKIIDFTVVAVGSTDGFTDGVLEISDKLGTFDLKVSARCVRQTHTVQVANIEVNTSTIFISPIGLVDYIPRTVPLEIIISIEPCPYGFHLSTDTNMCQCDSAVSSVAVCNSSSGTVTREGRLWLAYEEVDNCTTVHSGCPFDYCKTDSIALSLSDPDVQCSLNRAGRLCGGCLHGYSLMLGSNKCQQCTNESALALIIPFAVAGILLVALLVIFNLTVSIGTINGIVFYANVVKLYEPIFFPNGPIIVLSQFISWLNLDLGIETCFYTGMTSCHKMWLQFVFPFYIWILIIIVIVACHYSSKITRIIGNNAIPVLATLVLLSYTKLLRTIIQILSLTRVSCNASTEVYWFVDPNIPYLHSCHLPLFVVAMLILCVLVIPYTISLLAFPILETTLRHKWQFLKKLYSKSKPFVDAYGGPYNDTFHYWTGVSVLLRVILALVVALSDDPTTASDVLLLIITVYIMTLSRLKIYRQNVNYVLDVWSSLSLMAIGYLAHDNSNKLSSTIMLAILSCNVAIFVSIMVMHFWKFVFLQKCRRVRGTKRMETVSIGRSIRLKSADLEFGDSALLREPLLEEV